MDIYGIIYLGDNMDNQIGLMIRYERIKQKISQQKLSEGICSVSYLSKIENLDAFANNDLLNKLFRSLGKKFQTDQKILSDFKKESLKIWNAYFEFDDANLKRLFKESKIISEQSIKFSQMGVDFLLLNMLLRALNNDLDIESINDFSSLSKFLSEKQQYQLDILTLKLKINKNINLDTLDLKISDAFGNADYLISLALFNQKNYIKSLKYSRKAYQTFSSIGNIMGMMKASLMIEKNCLHTGSLNFQIEELHKILRLNRFINDKSIEKEVYFSLGSAYLLKQDFNLSIRYLEACVQMINSSSILFPKTLERLALASVLSDKIELAGISNQKLLQIKGEQSIQDMIQIMISNKDFIHDSMYQKKVSDAYKKWSNDISEKLLYGGLLYQVYKKTYNYNKALKLLEFFKDFDMIPFSE